MPDRRKETKPKGRRIRLLGRHTIWYLLICIVPIILAILLYFVMTELKN